ncbi:hypothetical protein ABLE68_15435 [Nocardioides sp. CN2-186]|uniref:hypothetical protein n=1 Tax=Nocardioides tweenelious TaxID=3156607 RepID=UPI0032B549C8
MAIADDSRNPLSSSMVRTLLKRDDIGGSRITREEDPYSEILIQSVSFFGGEYLVSPGSGENTVSDVENLADAAFREDWMPTEVRVLMRQLIQGLLTVSNLVLTRAGLTRGTRPGRSPRTPVDVPSASRLEELARAAFVSHEDLEAHGSWLHMVVDTFALDPGELVEPCDDDVLEDRLLEMPFLRLQDGYQVAVPVDLLLTIRHHLLRFAYQEGQLDELGKRYRNAAVRRVERLLPRDAERRVLSEDESMNRFLFALDPATDLHVIAATDPLADWTPEKVWGMYDTHAVLNRIGRLLEPGERSAYSSAETVLHLVITDSPGRSSFWGVPNVDGADPVLMSRADDLEVMLHREPDGALGLLYFAEAVDRRPGDSMSTNILDEYTTYEDNEKSFYFSDDGPPNFVLFQTGDGYFEREKFFEETDRHGVEAPVPGRPMVQAKRRYNRDTPEIFVIESSASYIGYVVEVGTVAVFVSPDMNDEPSPDVAALLLECVSFWVRECMVVGAMTPRSRRSHLVVSPGPASAWRRNVGASAEHPIVATRGEGTLTLRFTDQFTAQLQEESNIAERHLVTALLTGLFEVDASAAPSLVDLVAPLGPKRMLNAFNEDNAPDMRAERLPAPLTGHEQVTAQILDELGEWLRHPNGAGLVVGPLTGDDRSEALNKAVSHLFKLLEIDVARYDQQALLDYLVAQNEALVYFVNYNARMLRSRLACFGADAETTKELVKHRSESATAHRANRFLIEYVAAQPPDGDRVPTTRDYYQLLGVAREIIDRGTASDFLHYKLADFDVSILESGRLGMNRDEPVDHAIKAYAEAAGVRAIRTAIAPSTDGSTTASGPDIVSESAGAMRSEYGFTLADLREVCGGLLDLGTADQVTRIARPDALSDVATNRSLDPEVVETVLHAITLTPREDFMSIGPDAVPWRFNRNMSYVRRPLVLQGEHLVFGFRSVLNTGPYWYTSLTSGRLQASAKTQAMKAYVSEARGRINDAYAADVAQRLRDLGVTAELAVDKIGGTRIADADGLDLGDIDVLAWHPDTRTVVAIEAKDFEIARTPAEMSHEVVKLFAGKQGKKPERSTVEKHRRRIEWLGANLARVLTHFGVDGNADDCSVVGVVVTSDPLVSPLIETSPVPVLAFADLDLDVLGLRRRRERRKERGRR